MLSQGSSKTIFNIIDQEKLLGINTGNTKKVFHCNVIIHQSVPDGKLNLVSPLLAKLDLEALMPDIPKYHQNMPETASDAWEQWLDKVDTLAHVPNDYDWPIDILKNAARARPPPPAALISPDLLEMRDKETQPTQEVHK